ncbi:hypothetical protein KXS07_35945 [Inquilinus limosus]
MQGDVNGDGQADLQTTLTPNRGSEDYGGRPTPMPALGGAAAQPLRFLDFLIYQPIRAVLLHGAGVPVNVPAPERYAIHKLIIASRRGTDSEGKAKSPKDRMQAATIMEAMIMQRQTEDLADAFMESLRPRCGLEGSHAQEHGSGRGRCPSAHPMGAGRRYREAGAEDCRLRSRRCGGRSERLRFLARRPGSAPGSK